MNEVIIKTPEEIEKMRELGRLVAEALDYIGQFVKPGRNHQRNRQTRLRLSCKRPRRLSRPLALRQPALSPNPCCTSVNHVICHGIPDDKPLKEGDIINIDLTIKKTASTATPAACLPSAKFPPLPNV